MLTKKQSIAITGFLVSIAMYGSMFTVQSCGDAAIVCPPDARPDDPYCGTGGGGGGGEAGSPGLNSESCTGQCLPMSTSGFATRISLVWMGKEGSEPQCPERAESVYFTGYKDLNVAVPCQKCECGPAECILPSGLVAHSENSCLAGNTTKYDGPAQWDGSCVSPAQVPAGEFRSIELTPAQVSSCKPIGDAEPKAPSFAPKISDFAGGVYWKNSLRACQGNADGKCSSGFDCVPNVQPAPPEFRYCVEYIRDIDENDLPYCPHEYPDRFVYYEEAEGKAECSPCECGDPVGAQCTVSFSAYQDTTCSGAQMPLFENVPAASGNGTCIDFGGMSVALESMSAQWSVNQPGQCLPKGGELVGEVKPAKPHMFCCKPLEAPMKAPKE